MMYHAMAQLEKIVLLLLFTLLVAACQPDILTPPRLATATAQAQGTPTPTAEPLILRVTPETTVAGPEAEIPTTVAPDPVITVWVNETSEEHREALQTMVDAFREAQQINVALRLVEPSLLPKLVETAVISDAFSLPDVIIHPLEYTAGWAERGILDSEAANAVIEALDRETFDPDALNLVTIDGVPPAIPSDAYQQLIIYRTDWFAANDLAPPDNFEAMFTAAQTLSNTQNLISGFVVPTESNLITTQKAFEQMANANGCDLVDEKGEILILEPACQEALDFYYNIIHNFSPIGVQTDTSTRNAYLFGRTGLIMFTPDILPQLAGLDPDALPTCAECMSDTGEVTDYLAQNSGIITLLTGSGPLAKPTNFGNVTYLGITTAANTEAAIAFATYWFNEGYLTWLGVETERKAPMRWGTAEQPRLFIDTWGTLPLGGSERSLVDLYGQDTVDRLYSAVANSDRWGFQENQGELMTTLYEELVFSIVLQEMLSGYFTTQQTLVEAYLRVIDLIPNYQYDRHPASMVTPTP